MTYLKIYRLTSDTGLAPCAENGLLSLSCCKGGQIRNGKVCHRGLRYEIGSKQKGIDYDKDKVYILGTYEGRLLYIARITDVVTMKEYFGNMAHGRTDDIFDLVKGELVRNNHLRNEGVHIEKERIQKDLAGEYVLLSDDFVYLGKDAITIDCVTKYNAKYQETKTYEGELADQIVARCYMCADGKTHTPTMPFRKNGGCR